MLFRLYGEMREESDLFRDIIQTTIISEKRIGPKVLALFNSGRLEQFINVIIKDVTKFYLMTNDDCLNKGSQFKSI